MNAEEQFEQLAQEVSMAAARVDCSPDVYQDGLKVIIEWLENDLAASQDMGMGQG
jgi:hypothetical protein